MRRGRRRASVSTTRVCHACVHHGLTFVQERLAVGRPLRSARNRPGLARSAGAGPHPRLAARARARLARRPRRSRRRPPLASRLRRRARSGRPAACLASGPRQQAGSALRRLVSAFCRCSQSNLFLIRDAVAGAPATSADPNGGVAPVTTGSSNPPYVTYTEKDQAATGQVPVTLHFQSISSMPAYRGSSFEVRQTLALHYAPLTAPRRKSASRTTHRGARPRARSASRASSG